MPRKIAEAVKGDVDTFLNAPRRKIKVGKGVTPELCAKEVGFTWHVPQGDAEKDL